MKTYIDRINVYGFKSYGDRHLTIPIGPVFTAIVGPNGAGKSNIGDSIVFCLGIASARAMRALKLTDLIFSSKDKTAPYAEVEIVFKNLGAFPVNSEEVRISRKVELSGKSTYKINGKTVKQQEVEDLLTQAEIPIQGYNIVTQGDIYKFVNMTPGERRELLSEIAGITIYEEKKQKASTDLKEAQEKVDNVKAVLKEIEHTLKKLQQEKENAILAINIESQIKELENRLLGAKLYHLLSQKQQALEHLQDIEKDLQQFYKSKEENIEKQKQILNQIRDLENKLNEIQNSFLPIKEQEGSITASIKSLNEKKDTLEKEIQSTDSKIKQLIQEKGLIVKDILKLEEEIKALEKQLPDIEKKLLEAEKELEEKNKKLKEYEIFDSSVKNDLGEIERQEKELLDKIKQLEKQKVEYQLKYTTTVEKSENYKKEIESLKQEVENIKKTIENIKSNTKDSQKEVLSITSEINRLKIRKDVLEKRLKENREKLEKNFQELAKVLAQLSNIREDKTSLLFKNIEGVYGAVSEIISIKDPKVQAAIELAGGGRLKNVVVENEDVAKKCLDILKQEKAGRVTFIPLNKIKVQDNPKLPLTKGVLGYAIDFVNYDKKVEKAIKYVFQDTIIIDTFDTAKVLGIGNYRMVTLDGEVFEKSGIITGGSEKQSITIGKLFLEEERKKLEDIDQKLKEEERAIENELKLINQKIAENEKNLVKLQTESKSVNVRIQELEKQLTNKNLRIGYIENEIFNLKKQSLELESKIEEINNNIQSLNLMLSQVKDKKEKMLNRMESMGLNKLRKEWEETTQKVYLLRDKKKELENQIEKLKSKVESHKIRVFQIESEKSTLEKELYNKKSEIENIKSEIDNLTKQLSELWKGLKGQEEEREKLINTISNLKDQLKNLRYEEDNINRQTTLLLQDKAKAEQKIADLEEEIILFKEEYSGEPIEEDVKKIEKKLKELQERRKNLGFVNEKAIEDYEEEEKRYNEIKEKLDTLINEKKAIEELIESLEEKKVKAFMEVFENINKNLAKNFKILSPSGKAYLELENEQNPLSGGVFLKARPRGKDVKRLEMMSGGEKTLTALSFLFAVQQYRPAPFYYFDEVDAALDDANARKVGQLMKELSKEAQFIVVTHRDAMASFADRIIGVSAKDGISNIYTLDINQIRGEQSQEVNEEVLGVPWQLNM